MLFKLALAALLSGQAADTTTTVRLLQHPASYRETNPLLPQSPVALTAIKIGATSTAVVMSWHLRKTHPKLAVGLLLLDAASGWYAAEHNLRVGRR